MFDEIRPILVRRRAARLLLSCGLSGALMLLLPWTAAALSLAEAETIALEQDPMLRALSAQRSAMEERAVAAGQLPDPMVKAGFMSLPTDTWNLGQEAMTQVQVGVVQQFPRGRSRSLRSEQIREQSASLAAAIRDQRLQRLRTVREEYLEVAKQVWLTDINAEAQAAFTELADITQDYYATGRVQQQDVLRSAVELARVEDRATRIRLDEERARARLAAWVGEAAFRELDHRWAEISFSAIMGEVDTWLMSHPRIEALQEQVAVAETGVELAEQRYKPGFSVDLTYGGRGGSNPDGSDRTDLMSVMLMMDVPLFHGNRQDRYKAAAVSETSAALFRRDDALRSMRSEGRMQLATLRRQQERLLRFEESLLPDAEANSESAYSAYQAALGDLTALMRARITEFELRLEYAALRAETMKTVARLQYLQGESS
jgi:outer membrane protein TolC